MFHILGIVVDVVNIADATAIVVNVQLHDHTTVIVKSAMSSLLDKTLINLMVTINYFSVDHYFNVHLIGSHWMMMQQYHLPLLRCYL